LTRDRARDYAAGLGYSENSAYENGTLQLEYLIWFNKTYDHTVPIAVNLAHNILFFYLPPFCVYFQTEKELTICYMYCFATLPTTRTGSTSLFAHFAHVLTVGELALYQSNPNNVVYFSVLIMAAFAMILGGLIMPLAQEKALSILIFLQ
jgi:hypothetical protein